MRQAAPQHDHRLGGAQLALDLRPEIGPGQQPIIEPHAEAVQLQNARKMLRGISPLGFVADKDVSHSAPLTPMCVKRVVATFIEAASAFSQRPIHKATT
jgi:hypothetical protein